MLKKLAAPAVLLAVGIALAPSAAAATYADSVAGTYNPQRQHVFSDPAARLPLRNPAALNATILGSHKPLYVADVAANQNITADDVYRSLNSRAHGKFNGVIVVAGPSGYNEGYYNVPASIANVVKPDMDAAAKANPSNPDGALTAFAQKLGALNVSPGGPTTSSNLGTPSKTSWTWLWVTLTAIAAVAILVVLGFFATKALSRRSRRRAERDNIENQLISLAPKVARLEANVIARDDVDVSSESQNATTGMAAANKAFDVDNLNSAESYIGMVKAQLSEADAKLYPRTIPKLQPHGASSFTSNATPPADAKQGTVKAKNPDTGRTVTINNNNYSTSQSGRYNHYYGGGYSNGMYFYPGYYPYNYWGGGWGWNPVDVLIADELLNDRWGGSYPSGSFSGDSNTSYDGGTSDGWTTDDNSFTSDSGSDSTSYDGGSADSGSDSSSYDGGSDWGSDSGSSDTGYSGSDDSGSSSTSYDSSPSYDYSSSSSSDSGSSWDSGSSFDSGGGSFDSGSSGW